MGQSRITENLGLVYEKQYFSFQITEYNPQSYNVIYVWLLKFNCQTCKNIFPISKKHYLKMIIFFHFQIVLIW